MSKGRTEIRCYAGYGLYKVVQPSGAMSWAVRFRRPSDGLPVKWTIGTVQSVSMDKAIEAATVVEKAVHFGVDPDRRLFNLAAGRYGVQRLEYLYLVQASAGQKVGIATNLDQRMRSLAGAMPDPYDCDVFYFELPEAKPAERDLHKMLADYHSHGEWFKAGQTCARMMFEAVGIAYGGREMKRYEWSAPVGNAVVRAAANEARQLTLL